MSDKFDEHVSADRLQALLDHALPSRERAQVEEHVAACPRCSDDLESWRSLFEDLASLPQHSPQGGFQGRVMASIELPRRVSLAERMRRRLLAVLPSPHPEHLAGERLQDFLDGVLTARQVARVGSHLEGCTACSAEIDAWRGLYARLDRLDGFAPREGFGDRVMEALQPPAHAPAHARRQSKTAPALGGLRLPDWGDARAALARFVPKTRRAWATISGMAVTPAVSGGLVLYTVFSHPTLTPQALASFTLWKLADLFALAWSALGATALGGAQVLGVDTVVRTLFDAPFMLAGGALVYSVFSALALRVLYKNLLGDRRHARLSHS